MPIPPSLFYGLADPDTTVEAVINGNSCASTKADESGRWILPVDVAAACGPKHGVEVGFTVNGVPTGARDDWRPGTGPRDLENGVDLRSTVIQAEPITSSGPEVPSIRNGEPSEEAAPSRDQSPPAGRIAFAQTALDRALADLGLLEQSLRVEEDKGELDAELEYDLRLLRAAVLPLLTEARASLNELDSEATLSAPVERELSVIQKLAGRLQDVFRSTVAQHALLLLARELGEVLLG